MLKTNDPQIVVGFRRKDEPEKDHGPEMYFSINILGIEKAMIEAQQYLEKQSKTYRNLDYKMWGFDRQQ